MTTNTDPARACGDDDRPQMARLLSLCFALPDDQTQLWLSRMDPSDVRLSRVDGRLAAMLLQIPMGQWYGGRRIPMVGIAAVGTFPEYRDRGLVASLLADSLREMRQRGVPLSTLYPATRHVYRRLGYELAGARFRTTLSLRELPRFESDLAIEPIAEDRRAAVEATYAFFAAAHNGMLDRNAHMWLRVREPRGQKAEGYLFSRDGRVEGYMYYLQTRGNPHPFSMQVSDWVATTPDALRASLRFLHRCRSLVSDVTWFSAPVTPLHAVLSEQCYTMAEDVGWMLRVVDVEQALVQRGYNAAVSASLHLDVRDDVLPENAGRWQVEIGEGNVAVKRGGRGEIRLDIRALAAIYSGHLTPFDLAMTGQVEGPPESLAAMQAAFAGQPPWMLEQF